MPPAATDRPVTPLRPHTFQLPALAVVEVERDVFYISIVDSIS